VLRRIYQKPPKTDAQLAGLAARRIYELAPEEGRRYILDEMRRPQARVGMDVLGVLSDESLPEVDSLVAERLAAPDVDEEIVLPLAERYATAAVSAQLRAAYEDRIGLMACEPQAALIGYFLRVEPAYGARLVEKAQASRKQTGCYSFVLQGVAPRHMNREFEEVATAALDDADSLVVVDAAQVLGGFGSAAARDSLLHRFERWHEEWAGRAKELSALDDKDIAASPSRAEAALLHALATAPAWLADSSMLERLRSLCVTESCVREAESLRGQFGTSVTVFFAGGEVVSDVSVAQYNSISWTALKEKLLQFPEGTAFEWNSDAPGTEAEARAFAELKEHLEKAGMKLARRRDDSK
jgi:hypothetical protein